MPASGTIAGVLLAAGTSSRFGRNKVLLELDGEPLLARAARRAGEAGLEPLVVVIGHEAERARAALGGVRCAVVEHPGFAAGMATSLAAGVRALPPAVDGVVVLLADMPLVGPEVVRALVERRRATGAPVVASRYGGVVAPPTFFEAALFPALLAGQGDGGARALVAAQGERARFVDLPAGALLDLDGPGDLERLGPASGAGGAR